MTLAEKRDEDAVSAWLEAPVSATAETERGDATAPLESGAPEESGVRERATEGHSPSARVLVNTSDTVVRLSASVAVEPPRTLRSRVLAGVQRAVSPRPAMPPGGPIPLEIKSPNELVGRLHAADPREPIRRGRIQALNAAGGPGEEKTNEALAVLLDQVAPFFGFEVVLVSAVVDDKTIHRVHRGFPAELGNMDVVPRALSFCTHTVSAGEPFFVENTLTEAFFRSSVLVQHLGARAYLGVPLFSEEIALGSLCVISSRPQKVTGLDVAFLSGFGKVAQALILHDARALERLIGSAEPVASLVYSPAFLDELVTAQAARAKSDPASHATSHVRLARTLSDDASVDTSFQLPRSLVVGDDGDSRVVLVPERHPDSSELLKALVGRGATVRKL